MISIVGSVGLGGTNRPVDVMLVQYLLNLNYETTGITSALPLTGVLQREALAAITTFQRDVMKSARPDGRVSVGGPTFRRLAAADATSLSTLAALRAVMGAIPSYGYLRAGDISSSLGLIDIPRFLQLYDTQFTHLGSAAMTGLTDILQFMNDDAAITDIGWGAYMLATVKHECAERWRPIEEFGRGAGRSYGTAINITDPATGTRHTNAYFGRGYVQLTWEANYRSIGRAIGLGDSLWVDPSLALDAQVAYAIMSYGMRNGSFTSRKLATYINRSACDYEQARRIINGLDVYQKIARYAEAIELLLRASGTATFSHCL